MCKGGGFPCYAYRLANTRLKERYCFNTYLAPGAKGTHTDNKMEPGSFLRLLTEDYADPFSPRFWPERLEELRGLTKRAPRGIFVADMGDLFGIGVPEDWTNEVLDAIQINKTDRFYLLTKQPQNLRKFSPFPNNCWVGVTATSYQMFADACDELNHIEAKVKYISFEPLLSLEFSGPNLNFWLVHGGISWVIIGAQTKPYNPPEWEWVKDILFSCATLNIPCFLKNNLGSVVPQPLPRGPLLQEVPLL